MAQRAVVRGFTVIELMVAIAIAALLVFLAAPSFTTFLRNSEMAREKGINRLSNKALSQLMSYSWPGNVRELGNVIERAILRTSGSVIREVDLPGQPVGEALDVEGLALMARLEKSDGPRG